MATLDPSIILQGQPVDVVGAMARGNELAGQTNAIRQQMGMQNLFKTQGANILAGDQGALNALAGYSPEAALGIQSSQLGLQSQRQDMQATQQRMDILSREEQRAIEDFKANKGAAAAQAAAAQIEEQVRMGMAIPDAASWDAFMAQSAPELVGQFGNRQALAAKYMSMADVLKMNEAPKADSRFKVVGSQLVDLMAEGGPKAVIDAPGQTETIFGPDGKPIVTRGPAGSKPLTEAQSKDLTYATRARGALSALEAGTPNALSSRGDVVLDALPLGLGRELQSPEYQTAQTAGNEFLQAILRKDTGAAITADEQKLYGETYLPQPGDSPERLSYKKTARERALIALEAGMPPDAILRQEQALQVQGGAPNLKRIEIDGFQIEAIE